MPKQTKNCRVCGKVYEACRSIKTGDTVFNWREVACSPECGKIYLQRVMASRSGVLSSCDNGKEDELAEHRVSRKKKSAPDVSANSSHEAEGSDAESCEE